MSKIKIRTDEFGDSSVIVNINVPIEVFIGDFEDHLDLKAMPEIKLIDLINKRLDDISSSDLANAILAKVDIENDVEREDDVSKTIKN